MRANYLAKIPADTKNNDENRNSRALIQALKNGIQQYCTPMPGSFLMGLPIRSRTSDRAAMAELNITRLHELEKKYGINAEIPKEEILASLISTGPAFAEMVYRCFEKFEVEVNKNSPRKL